MLQGAPIDFDVRSKKQPPGARSIIESMWESLTALASTGPEENRAQFLRFLETCPETRERFQEATPLSDLRRVMDRVDFYKQVYWGTTTQLPMRAVLLDSAADLQNTAGAGPIYTIFRPLVGPAVLNTDGTTNMTPVALSPSGSIGLPVEITGSADKMNTATNVTRQVTDISSAIVVGATNGGGSNSTTAVNNAFFRNAGWRVFDLSGTRSFQTFGLSGEQTTRLWVLFPGETQVDKIVFVKPATLATFPTFQLVGSNTFEDVGGTGAFPGSFADSSVVNQTHSGTITIHGYNLTFFMGSAPKRFYCFRFPTNTSTSTAFGISEMQLYSRESVNVETVVSVLGPLYDEAWLDISGATLATTSAILADARNRVSARISEVETKIGQRQMSLVERPLQTLIRQIQADKGVLATTTSLLGLSNIYAFYRYYIDNPIPLEINPDYSTCIRR